MLDRMLRRNPLAAMALHRPARSLSLQHLQLAAEASGAAAHGGDQQSHADQAEDAAEVRTHELLQGWTCKTCDLSAGDPSLMLQLRRTCRWLPGWYVSRQVFIRSILRFLWRCGAGDGGDARSESQRRRARCTHHTEGSARASTTVIHHRARPSLWSGLAQLSERILKTNRLYLHAHDSAMCRRIISRVARAR